MKSTALRGGRWDVESQQHENLDVYSVSPFGSSATPILLKMLSGRKELFYCFWRATIAYKTMEYVLIVFTSLL